MPILNLNGTTRKNAKPISGDVFRPGIASQQHGTLTVAGTSYNSPFTSSAAPVNNGGRTIATQPQLPALKVESPGTVVHLNNFVKVHPWEKGKTFHTPPVGTARPVAGRVMGPSKQANTAANPNRTPPPPPRPVRKPSLSNEKRTGNGSFLHSNQHLSSKANHDVVSGGRWAHGVS